VAERAGDVAFFDGAVEFAVLRLWTTSMKFCMWRSVPLNSLHDLAGFVVSGLQRSSRW